MKKEGNTFLTKLLPECHSFLSIFKTLGFMLLFPRHVIASFSKTVVLVMYWHMIIAHSLMD